MISSSHNLPENSASKIECFCFWSGKYSVPWARAPAAGCTTESLSAAATNNDSSTTWAGKVKATTHRHAATNGRELCSAEGCPERSCCRQKLPHSTPCPHVTPRRKSNAATLKVQWHKLEELQTALCKPNLVQRGNIEEHIMDM